MELISNSGVAHAVDQSSVAPLVLSRSVSGVSESVDSVLSNTLLVERTGRAKKVARVLPKDQNLKPTVASIVKRSTHHYPALELQPVGVPHDIKSGGTAVISGVPSKRSDNDSKLVSKRAASTVMSDTQSSFETQAWDQDEESSQRPLTQIDDSDSQRVKNVKGKGRAVASAVQSVAKRPRGVLRQRYVSEESNVSASEGEDEGSAGPVPKIERSIVKSELPTTRDLGGARFETYIDLTDEQPFHQVAGRLKQELERSKPTKVVKERFVLTKTEWEDIQNWHVRQKSFVDNNLGDLMHCHLRMIYRGDRDAGYKLTPDRLAVMLAEFSKIDTAFAEVVLQGYRADTGVEIRINPSVIYVSAGPDDVKGRRAAVTQRWHQDKARFREYFSTQDTVITEKMKQRMQIAIAYAKRKMELGLTDGAPSDEWWLYYELHVFVLYPCIRALPKEHIERDCKYLEAPRAKGLDHRLHTEGEFHEFLATKVPGEAIPQIIPSFPVNSSRGVVDKIGTLSALAKGTQNRTVRQMLNNGRLLAFEIDPEMQEELKGGVTTFMNDHAYMDSVPSSSSVKTLTKKLTDPICAVLPLFNMNVMDLDVTRETLLIGQALMGSAVCDHPYPNATGRILYSMEGRGTLPITEIDSVDTSVAALIREVGAEIYGAVRQLVACETIPRDLGDERLSLLFSRVKKSETVLLWDLSKLTPSQHRDHFDGLEGCKLQHQMLHLDHGGSRAGAQVLCVTLMKHVMCLFIPVLCVGCVCYLWQLPFAYLCGCWPCYSTCDALYVPLVR